MRTATETSRHASSRRLFACAFVLCFAAAARADDGIEAAVRLMTERYPTYGGPTRPFPDGGLRPSATREVVVCSELLPLCVHAAGASPARRVSASLRALELGYAWLEREGWPLPYPDAGQGGSSAFDLYLVRGAESAAAGLIDQPVAASAFDAATSYAVLDAELPDAALERCALYALTEAALFAEGPVESALTRRASARFATFLAGYGFGCDDARHELQGAPELGLVGELDEQASGLALLLASVSRRHDGQSGRLVRGLWQAIQKHSQKPSSLHVAPSFLDALNAALEQSHESLDGAATEFAAARYLEADALGLGTKPRWRQGPTLETLPKLVAGCDAALGTYGSAYLRVPTRGARDGMRLQVWLRGESNVRWSLAAVRLDASARELGRLQAPPRPVPQSFLPVELTGDTSEVLIIVTELPWKHPDPFAKADDDYCFQLILDRADG